MASKNPHDATPTESDGETIALRIKNKRARRVSFADTEITSVHIFRRDDEYETPPESKPSPPAAAAADADSRPEVEVLGYFRDLGSDSDDSGGEDGGSVDVRKSFLRPIGSPSPGGSGTAGSASSDNEDNIFGPVSSSFIRPGWLSDSGVSDDIHEETLDTTAFSLHYRSLARSDSGEVQTPTTGRLVVEEKTTTKESNPSNSGSLMALTEPKRLVPQSLLVPPVTVGSGEEDSDDMSIVDENPKIYDYGILSPSLDALLGESNNHLNADSAALPIRSKSANGNEASAFDQIDVPTHVEGSNNQDSRKGYFHTSEKSAEVASLLGMPRDPNSDFADLITFDNLPDESNNQQGYPNLLTSESKSLTEDEGSLANLMSSCSVLQPDVGPEHELGDLYLNSSSAIKNSSFDLQHNAHANHHLDKQLGSPLSKSATRQPQLNTPNSVRASDRVLPSLRKADRDGNGDMKLDDSISMFRIHEGSYTSSSIKQGTDKLKQRLSKYSSISSPFGSGLHENSKLLQSVYLGTPVAGLNAQLFYSKQKNNEDRSLISLDVNRVETPRSTIKPGKNDGTFRVEDEDPPYSKSSNGLSRDKPDKLMTSLFSTFDLISPRSKGMTDSLISEDSSRTMFLSSVTDSGLKNDEEINIPRLQIESETLINTSSPIYKINSNFQPESSEKNLQINPGNKEETPTLLDQVKRQDPQGETPGRKAARKKQMDESSSKNSTRRSPRFLPSSSPLMVEPTSRSPKKVAAVSSPGKELPQPYPRLEPLPSPRIAYLSTSPHRTEANQSSCRKDRIESPSKPDKALGSPQTAANMDGCDDIRHLHISESPLCVNDVSISAVRKRGRTPIILGDGEQTHKSPRINKSQHNPKSGSIDSGLIPDHVVRTYENRSAAIILRDGEWTRRSPTINKIQHNPKSGNVDSGLIPDRVIRTSNEKDKNEGVIAQKHWPQIFESFSWDVEHLISRSVSGLNFESSDTLEDILNEVVKVKNYETLRSELQSQKRADQFSLKHKKRIAQTRSLLLNIALEKAKLQLRCDKHDKLKKKLMLLKSGIHECQMLKSKHIQLSKIGRRDTQHGDQLQPALINLVGQNQVASVTVDKMTHDIKALDEKINDFSNLFQKYCKIQGESNCVNTIASIQDHLMRRNRCRLIRQDLQLWKIGSFECQNGQFNILLNYQGYLSQRFTLTSGMSSIVISNQLNDVSILKAFPNMNAFVAFAFVFNAEVAKRGADSKCLVQQTQATHSLLRNLLDVIDEVQMAQVEIGNLVQANFYCSSGHRLDLHLYFLTFGSGVKVTLTLDVTCLSSGIYPSEAVPYEVQVPRVGSQKSKLLSDEIIPACENLEAGYFRITRLCRRVSQLLRD